MNVSNRRVRTRRVHSNVRHRRSAAKRRLRFEVLERRDLLAVDATFGLGQPMISGTVVSFEVTLDFKPTAGEELAFFGLDTAPSSPALIGPGPDFSAFSFSPASPLLDDWSQIGFFNDSGFESSVEFDDSLIAPLPSGAYSLGVLSIDLAVAGLTFNDVITVSIAGADSVIGVNDPAQGFVFVPVGFDPPSRTLIPVSLSGSSAVSEGSPYTLMIDTAVRDGVDFAVDWGDGQQETIHAADLPAGGEVLHTFADGPGTPTIAVELVDGSGTHKPVGSLEVTVNNVPPTVALSGPSNVDEGSPFTLTVGPVTDPGADTVTQYRIDWGDGQQQVIDAADLPANREVTHAYADGPASRSIMVGLVDEDGIHAAAGTLDVTVDDVPPSLTLSGPDAIDEGAAYALTIGPVTDPGEDTVAQYIIDWGDGQQQTIDAADLPPDGIVSHVYTHGPLDASIALTLVDEDGPHTGLATKAVSVVNQSPSLNVFTSSASAPGETDPGETVTATVEFTDASTFDSHHAVIDWGDGSGPRPFEVAVSNGVGSGSATHTYAGGGVYQITLELTDLGGNTMTGEGVAYVTGLRQLNKTLQLVGSEGNDILTVTPAGTSGMFVNFTTPGGGNIRSTFSLANVQGIEVYVGAGNDRVMVSDRLQIETYLDGGPDDDHVQGGNGPNVVLGGSGHDMVLGGQNRDILVGGEGCDQILGYGEDDVLVGGSWVHPEAVWRAIMEGWRSTEPFEVRAARIIHQLEVMADDAGDTLFGGDGENLFLVSEGDAIKNGGSDVSCTVADAIASGWAQTHDESDGIYTVVIPTLQSGAAARAAGPWTNSVNPLDVNNDGVVSPPDALAVINELNSNSEGRLTDQRMYVDPSGDGLVTPLDALLVITEINIRSVGGEGELPAFSSSSAESRGPEMAHPDDPFIPNVLGGNGNVPAGTRTSPTAALDNPHAASESGGARGANPHPDDAGAIQANRVSASPISQLAATAIGSLNELDLEIALNEIACDIASAATSDSARAST